MPWRPLRVYPALLSTEAEALAWARAGAPPGSLVVADYQVSPRGRAGLPWEVHRGRGLGFSLVFRPRIRAEDEGWLYTVAVSGLADVADAEAVVDWPDEVRVGDRRVAAVGVQTELGTGDPWAVVTVLVEDATPPRGPRLVTVVEAIEARYRGDDEQLVVDYRRRCATLGRQVRARLIPMGPAGPQVEGEAVDVKQDGTLVIRTEAGQRVAVRPQHLGRLEDA